ncbi:hypothetical protein GCM10020370_64960 [Paenibacillus hodogayensis]
MSTVKKAKKTLQNRNKQKNHPSGWFFFIDTGSRAEAEGEMKCRVAEEGAWLTEGVVPAA